MSGGSRPTFTDDKLHELMNPEFLKAVSPIPGSQPLLPSSRTDVCVEPTRPIRPDLPSPADKLGKEEQKAKLTFQSIQAIPEVASTSRHISEEPCLIKSSGYDSPRLPSFFPALIMPWQQPSAEVKKPTEPRESLKPQETKRIQEALGAAGKPHGIYQEGEPSCEGTVDDLQAYSEEIQVSVSSTGFYEDEEPSITKEEIFKDPYSFNQVDEEATASRGYYEDT